MTITTSTYSSNHPSIVSTTSLYSVYYLSEQKLGHPVPELNFVSEEKGSLQAAQNTRPFRDYY
jgi:hypothetical protein